MYQVGGTKSDALLFDINYLNDVLDKAPTTSPSAEIPKFNDPLLYIYTSGTTGLPKAAIMNNARCVGLTLFVFFKEIFHYDL